MHVKRNLIANYLGQGWCALMNIAFVPVYIRLLGMEAYGLIGFFTVLQSSLGLLDLGMTPTLNREIARFTSGKHTTKSIWELLRSLELLCFSIAVLIAISLWAVSSSLARNWLQPEQLTLSSTSTAIAVMGLVIALRLLEGLYHGAIFGFQRHVWLNSILAFFATVRGLGSIGMLLWIAPTIEIFFVWQVIVSVLTTAVCVVVVYKLLPTPLQRPRFSWPALVSVWEFTRGMIAISFLSIILTQADKIVLSHLLPLKEFGHYTFAVAVAFVLYQVVAPVVQTFYPRFTQLLAEDKVEELTFFYHFSAQVVSSLLGSVGAMLVFFGDNVLELWTGDPTLASKVAPILQLLAVGTLLNGLMNIPYTLQLAYGWSSFTARVNMLAVVILLPALFWAAPRYGAIGAAGVWFLLNSGYVLFAIHFMHRKLLPNEKWKWYRYDTFQPVSVAFLLTFLSWYLLPENLSKASEVAWLLFTGVISLIGAILVAPILKSYFLIRVSKREW